MAGIIADALDAVFEDTSVSEIFGGRRTRPESCRRPSGWHRDVAVAAQSSEGACRSPERGPVTGAGPMDEVITGR